MSDEMFPIAKDRGFVDVPLTGDELLSLVQVLTVSTSFFEELIKNSLNQTQITEDQINQYRNLATTTKYFKQKMTALANIGEPSSGTRH